MNEHLVNPESYKAINHTMVLFNNQHQDSPTKQSHPSSTHKPPVLYHNPDIFTLNTADIKGVKQAFNRDEGGAVVPKTFR